MTRAPCMLSRYRTRAASPGGGIRIASLLIIVGRLVGYTKASALSSGCRDAASSASRRVLGATPRPRRDATSSAPKLRRNGRVGRTVTWVAPQRYASYSLPSTPAATLSLSISSVPS